MQVRRVQKEEERLAQQQSSDRMAIAQKNRKTNYGLAPSPSISSEDSVNVESSLDNQMLEIDKMQDKEARKAYILNLAEPIKSNVIAELKRRKEDEETRKIMKQNEELDGLL
jgi:hypothetical protein